MDALTRYSVPKYMDNLRYEGLLRFLCIRPVRSIADVMTLRIKRIPGDVREVGNYPEYRNGRRSNRGRR
jgi:hypothetical protein